MKRTHIIGIVIIATAIMAIITTMGDASSYETFATCKLYPDKEFHVVGHLADLDRLNYDPEKDANFFSFYMKDNNDEERKVIFYGAKPRDFEKTDQIVLTGQIKDEVFFASKILMKCPSKYTETEVTATISEASTTEIGNQ